MLKILVLGYGPMGKALVQGVLACPDVATLVGVFPWSNVIRRRRESWEAEEDDFCRFLIHQRIRIIDCDSANGYDFIQLLTELAPDIVLVGSWGEILKPHVLTLPGIMFINCHPSLLPNHRGPNPYTTAILGGETQSGITFHQMDAGIDTGPLLLQAMLDLNPQETGETLRERCARLTESHVPELLYLAANDQLDPRPQPEGGHYYSITPDMVRVDWQQPVEILDRQFRALSPWLPLMVQFEKRYTAFRTGRVLDWHKTMAQPPGTILKYAHSEVWVATTDPAQIACLGDPQFPNLPRWAWPIQAWLMLRPGRRFQ